MSADILLYFVIALIILQLVLFITQKSKGGNGNGKMEEEVSRLSISLHGVCKDVARQEVLLKEELRSSRLELNMSTKDNREEIARRLDAFQYLLTETFNGFSNTQIEHLKAAAGSNQAAINGLARTLDQKIEALIIKTDDCHTTNRKDLALSLKAFSDELKIKLEAVTERQQRLTDTTVLQLEKVNSKLEEKLGEMVTRFNNSHLQMRASLDECFKSFEETFERNVRSFNEVTKLKFDEVNGKQQTLIDATVLQLDKVNNKLDQKLNDVIAKSEESSKNMRASITESFKNFGDAFDRNVQSFNNLQREKFSDLEKKQNELIQHTELKLEKMRETVDEKLQKTLDARLGQSFELVSKQLESVQRGLGEMQTLAQDVGGLKKVLSNVKTRGTLGEIQLGNILEQVLAPEQYDKNVRTKKGSADCVEFAIKLPGRDEDFSTVYLPVDAKFPNDAYQQLLTAYDVGDLQGIDAAAKNIENTLRKMAKDIRDKYLDPPNTTDFAIMFLPTEGLYAEIIRRCDLMEQLQREYKVVVTGPTTLAAILNSLQMGFRTLAIQKRTGEVWRVLSAVKTEFEKFGGMLEKAQKNLQTASNQIDEVIGRRTRAIQKTLKDVESLPVDDVAAIMGAIEVEVFDEEV